MSDVDVSDPEMRERTVTDKYLILYGQNVAAIAAEFFTHEKYQATYDQYSDVLSGIAGFYDLVADAGKILTDIEVEDDNKHMYEDGVNWYDLTTEIAEVLIERILDMRSGYGKFAYGKFAESTIRDIVLRLKVDAKLSQG